MDNDNDANRRSSTRIARQRSLVWNSDEAATAAAAAVAAATSTASTPAPGLHVAPVASSASSTTGTKRKRKDPPPTTTGSVAVAVAAATKKKTKTSVEAKATTKQTVGDLTANQLMHEKLYYQMTASSAKTKKLPSPKKTKKKHPKQKFPIGTRICQLRIRRTVSYPLKVRLFKARITKFDYNEEKGKWMYYIVWEDSSNTSNKTAKNRSKNKSKKNEEKEGKGEYVTEYFIRKNLPPIVREDYDDCDDDDDDEPYDYYNDDEYKDYDSESDEDDDDYDYDKLVRELERSLFLRHFKDVIGFPSRLFEDLDDMKPEIDWELLEDDLECVPGIASVRDDHVHEEGGFSRMYALQYALFYMVDKVNPVPDSVIRKLIQANLGALKYRDFSDGKTTLNHLIGGALIGRPWLRADDPALLCREHCKVATGLIRPSVLRILLETHNGMKLFFRADDGLNFINWLMDHGTEEQLTTLISGSKSATGWMLFQHYTGRKNIRYPGVLAHAETFAVSKYEGLFNDNTLLFLSGNLGYLEDDEEPLLGSSEDTLFEAALEELKEENVQLFHSFLKLVVRNIDHWKTINNKKSRKKNGSPFGNIVVNDISSSLPCCLLYCLAEFDVHEYWYDYFVKTCPLYLSSVLTKSNNDIPPAAPAAAFGGKKKKAIANEIRQTTTADDHSRKISDILCTALRLGGYPWEYVIKQIVTSDPSNAGALTLLDRTEHLPPFLLAATAASPAVDEGESDLSSDNETMINRILADNDRVPQYLKVRRAFEQSKSLISVNNSFELLRANPEALVRLL